MRRTLATHGRPAAAPPRLRLQAKQPLGVTVSDLRAVAVANRGAPQERGLRSAAVLWIRRRLRWAMEAATVMAGRV
jgi:hypothetical protein